MVSFSILFQRWLVKKDLPHFLIQPPSARHPDRQNVYLYCASAGHASVVRGSIDKDALAMARGMILRDNQKIILAQIVRWLKE
jgi:hypothetical protein